MKNLSTFLTFVLIFVFGVNPNESFKEKKNRIGNYTKQFPDSDSDSELESLQDLFATNTLLDTIPTRLSNIGYAYIVRDMVAALLASDRGSKIDSWVSTIMGIVALVTQQFGISVTSESESDRTPPDLTPNYFFNSTSRLLGVGVGLISISNDLNALIKSSKCLDVEMEMITRREMKPSKGSSSKSLISSSDPYKDGDDACAKNALADYLGNWIIVGLDMLAIIIPSSGPYSALIQAFRTIYMAADSS